MHARTKGSLVLKKTTHRNKPTKENSIGMLIALKKACNKIICAHKEMLSKQKQVKNKTKKNE